MSFLLKIVEGPNKGAEIALVEGVAVTLGKGDDCDVILADPTLPSAPATVAAAADGVTFDGVSLPPFEVVTRGATSFAVGPSDAPWGELKWPGPAAGEAAAADAKREEQPAPAPEKPAEAEKPAAEAPAEGKKGRRGCLGCLVALILFLAILAALAFFFREQARPQAERLWGWTTNTVSGVCERQSTAESAKTVLADTALTLEDVIVRHGLTATNRNARTVLLGDFATRAERLVATAEAYAARPGVALDFCDDESLKTAAEDTLALLTEKDLRVVAATNRVVALAGTARRIRRTLEALAADLPKLRNVDVSGVKLAGGLAGATVSAADAADTSSDAPTADEGAEPAGAAPAPAAPRPAAKPNLPVCGILTTPYPCLVLRSGARIHEGATFGDSVIVKIDADAVTVTNATGRFVWKP